MSTLPVIQFLLAFALIGACTPERGEHPESDVPEDHTRSYDPEYEGGQVKPGELEAPEHAPVARGDPPMLPQAEWSIAGDEWRITSVVIDVGLADVCHIEAAETHFDFDSAELDTDARARIAKIARCFVDGPLAGRDLVIIGHADPRGTDAYNRELGMSRAESVAKSLAREGLANTQIMLESRGEAEAHADPDEWPDDRRVDLRVAE